MVLGIDFGSTTTKIVLMDGINVINKYRIEREDSIEDILNELDLGAVSKIVTVGTGASYIDRNIRGIETKNVSEFQAVALGGHYLSGLDECLVVSLGTGTSFVYVNRDRYEHTGGCGIGGALLASMARYAGMADVNEFLELAVNGDINKSDLLIKDISKTNVGELLGNVTVANMAKITGDSKREDYAYGACNMIFQNIGVMAALADRTYETGKIVIMGSIGESEIAKQCFNAVGGLFGCDFIVPADAVYGVAIGAVLVEAGYVNNFGVYGAPMDEVDYMFE